MQVPSGSLRYIVGTVLSEGDQEPDKELEKGLMDEGFSVAELPEVSHMVYTTFPYITTLSIYIAVYRVYSALEDYVMVRVKNNFKMSRLKGHIAMLGKMLLK